MSGPAIQAVGFAWEAIHLVVMHFHDAITPRHIIFETPVLVIFVGFLVTVVTVPVALEVLQATDEELEMPAPAPEAPGSSEPRRAWELPK
jgi:hypothetical protein